MSREIAARALAARQAPPFMPGWLPLLASALVCWGVMAVAAAVWALGLVLAQVRVTPAGLAMPAATAGCAYVYLYSRALLRGSP